MKKFFTVTGLTAFITLFILSVLCPEIDSVFLLCFACIAAFCLVIVSVVLLCMKKIYWQIFITAAVCVFIFSLMFVLKYDNYISQRSLLADQSVFARFSVSDIQKSRSGIYYIYTASFPDKEFSYNVKIFSRQFINCEPGDIVCATVKFTEPDEEYTGYNISEDILLSGFINGFAKVEKSDFSLVRTMFGVRKYLSDVFEKTTDSSSGLANALVLGDTSGISSHDYIALRESGLLHIVSVSGLHISILAAFLSFLLMRFRKGIFTFIIYFIVLFSFAGICAFTPSVVRAVMMSLFAYGSRLIGERYSGINNLGFLLTVFLLFSPFLIFSVSFLLSYAATFGILIFNKYIYSSIATLWFKLTGRIPGKIIKTILVIFTISVSCFITTLPLMIYFFGTTNAACFISNPFCLPFIDLIFILLIITLVLGSTVFLTPFAEITGCIADKLIEVFMALVRYLSNNVSPFLSVDVTVAVSSLIVAGIVYVIVRFAIRTKEKRKRLYLYSLPAFALVVAVAISSITAYLCDEKYLINNESVGVGFIDVGQGNASVIISGDTAVVFDCGGEGDSGERTVEFLEMFGIRNIEAVILSHMHSDHYNGIYSLFEKYDVKKFIMSYESSRQPASNNLLSNAEENGAEIILQSGDFEINIGAVNIEILANHIHEESSDINENCMVSLVTYKDFSALLSADITKKTESRLIEVYGSRLDIDVYGVAHNGSDTSSSENFLQVISPECSIISVGENNSYGHPSRKVVDRLSEYGSVIRTDESGTVFIVSDGKTENIYTG